MNARNKFLIMLGVILVIAATYYFVSTPRGNDLVLVGTVDANQIVVSPQIQGRILKLLVEEGTQVKQGDLIAELDPSELEAEERAAAAMIESMRSQVSANEYTRQSTKGSTSSDVANAQAKLAAARAQLAQAEKGLADTTIRAPFDGNITARPVAAGEYVGFNNKIATIVRMGSLKLQLQTPEQRASQAKIGMPVVARVSAYPNREFTGKVTAIDASVDPTSRVFIVEARFDNGSSDLRPGMFAKARVLLPGGENAVFVPRSAILRDKTTDSNQVFAIENGKARLRVVVVGDADDGQVRIASGLTGNETVAVNHLSELFDGAAVESHN